MLAIMGGVNPAIQLAAALDRRGVTVSLDLDRVLIHIGGRDRMVIRPLASGVKPHDYGHEWSWRHGGEGIRHPRDDYEGTAEAVDKFLRSLPEFAGTALLYRMDHMDWTWEQETQEALERARRTGQSPGLRPVPANAAGADWFQIGNHRREGRP